ncbi:hypothetical protein [Acidicapsa acidisoli]|uniref:hypothetical protein n=1 Tax=Acidicapsa acidisoli TaxID=1615681 RepID=UPI0037C13A34
MSIPISLSEGSIAIDFTVKLWDSKEEFFQQQGSTEVVSTFGVNLDPAAHLRYTTVHGGKSSGSIRQWQPVLAI